MQGLRSSVCITFAITVMHICLENSKAFLVILFPRYTRADWHQAHVYLIWSASAAWWKQHIASAYEMQTYHIP